MKTEKLKSLLAQFLREYPQFLSERDIYEASVLQDAGGRCFRHFKNGDIVEIDSDEAARPLSDPYMKWTKCLNCLSLIGELMSDQKENLSVDNIRNMLTEAIPDGGLTLSEKHDENKHVFRVHADDKPLHWGCLLQIIKEKDKILVS